VPASFLLRLRHRCGKHDHCPDGKDGTRPPLFSGAASILRLPMLLLTMMVALAEFPVERVESLK
jgi:hypothetical protein